VDKIRIAVAGCGSVSGHYLAHLQKNPHAELAGACDVIEERYRERMAEFDIPRGFRSVGEMLAALDFDLLLNLTSMPAHYAINQEALGAGKHVFCEKPFAPAYAQGRELLDLAQAKGLRLWAAPNVVTSPQFRYMAEALRDRKIGKVHAAHACYGHSGPSWGPWFYRQGGGSLHDLAVYNITTLTGLLGPAKAVMALMGTAVSHRTIERESVNVEADDNVMLLLDHGDSAFSHIQSGFVYRVQNDDRTIEIIGLQGAMNLLGWDWAPKGVEIRLECESAWQTRCTAAQHYTWEAGAACAVEQLISDTAGLMTAEHALHVVEIMEAARESATTGRRIPIESSFGWPLF
jgi:predicted dehydrogenase